MSVDRAGGAEYQEYAVHMIKPPAGAEQVGLVGGPDGWETRQVVASTDYSLETASLRVELESNSTYLIVPSTKLPNTAGGFTVTTIGVGAYSLAKVGTLVQDELRSAMSSKMFEKLPELITRAALSGLGGHPLVQSAKLIGEIERGWQLKSAEIMGPAIVVAKRAKADREVVRTYSKRHKQLAIEAKLRKGLDGDTALLLAAVEEARIIGYSGNLMAEGEAVIAKYKTLVTLPSLFMDETAAGARKFGSWRENPTFQLNVTQKATIHIALNEDGTLSDEAKAKVEAQQAKAVARYDKARDRLAAAKAAAEADEKNEDLAAAAAEAERVLSELDEARLRKEKREADGDSGFTALGLHAVRNTKETWIPGVVSGYEDVQGTDPYGADQAYITLEVDPAVDPRPVFLVPSTWEPGEEGIFTLSILTEHCEVTVDKVPEFEGNLVQLKGEWSSSNQGPRVKKNGGKEDEDKKFKPEKTWNKNPQYRVWLKDPDDMTEHEEVGLQIVLSTPVEGAEMGLHVMRNTFCQFYNEKVEVLADRCALSVNRTRTTSPYPSYAKHRCHVTYACVHFTHIPHSPQRTRAPRKFLSPERISLRLRNSQTNGA